MEDNLVREERRALKFMLANTVRKVGSLCFSLKSLVADACAATAR